LQKVLRNLGKFSYGSGFLLEEYLAVTTSFKYSEIFNSTSQEFIAQFPLTIDPVISLGGANITWNGFIWRTNTFPVTYDRSDNPLNLHAGAFVTCGAFCTTKRIYRSAMEFDITMIPKSAKIKEMLFRVFVTRQGTKFNNETEKVQMEQEVLYRQGKEFEGEIRPPWWQVFTGYWRDSKTLTSQQNIAFYNITGNPNAILKPLRVTFNGTKLVQESLYGADRLRAGWQGTTPGTPLRWMPVGISRIVLNPAPSTTGLNIVIDGLAKAPIPATDASYIDLGEWLHNALHDYVAAMAAFKQGDVQTASQKYANFLQAAGRQNTKFRHSSIYRRALGADTNTKMQPVYEEQSAVRDRISNTVRE